MIELSKEIKKPKEIIRSATCRELLEHRGRIVAQKIEDAFNKSSASSVEVQK